MGKIIGIDLGTSTSEVAVLENGIVKVISNDAGEKITPSVVGLSEDGRIIVGQDARDQMLLRPEHTVIEAKRLMGSGSRLSMGETSYSPQEICSHIIKYLLKCAEDHLGEEVQRAVITVPAYFTDEQRRAVVEAGKLAGVKVERIINEPTAAALAYGVEHMEENRHVLVYDLGGGTLDVTVLEMFEGVLEVKASSGNNELGGKDFDQRLIDYLLAAFKEKEAMDLSGDRRALARIKEAAEACKIALSIQGEYPVVLPFIAEREGIPLALDTVITRGLFEEMITELIESTLKPVEVALGDAGLDKKDIDIVLMVGGSTRIPLVQGFLERELQQKPQALVDPDLAVVMGAALQAGIINQELSSQQDILITDVCPYTLGVEVVEFMGSFPVYDAYSPIIPRNTTIPVTREEIYGTMVDNQEKVEVKVYQGDYRRASRNNFLGKFILEGIPPAPSFQEKIKICFSYDVNGILQVEGVIVSTGEKAGTTIETTGVEMEKELDLSVWKKAPGARKYRGLIRRAERMLEQEMDPGFQIELDELITELKKALIQQEEEELLKELEEELVDLLYELEEEIDV